ncbi:MAG TPA: DUF1329 domain-containing protein, partial [Gammaproteobacteria bacterium]|nr:DUF1329 domain-containing protein [Gammaproteobacteria bacterium]
NMNVYLISQVVSPARLAGNVLLVWEPINLEKQHRSAWIYNPGQRRVRRAPNVRFDNTTGTHSDGLITDDMVNMWNGSLEQDKWKLLGKKEMYIPYNNYQIALPGTSYDKVIQAHHINQDLVRYELHRVWVVQATLRNGYRNVFSKRVFYLDEDSWNIAVGDLYDTRGNLWRVEQAYLGTAYVIPEVGAALATFNDLTSGRYFVGGLTSQKPQGIPLPTHLADSYFTPANLRRLGMR